MMTHTTNQPQFTLEELAHFNRCLFPATLEKLLVENGVDQGTAFMIQSWYKKNVHVGILGVYQEWAINDPELQQSINAMISSFVHPYRDNVPDKDPSPF